jgi:carboxymethylenebutenolidase
MPLSQATIGIRGGREFPGYMALPAAGSGPALLLASDAGRLDDEARRWADLYAEEGYVVFAPALGTARNRAI